jgi:alkyl hydroperoxide reductase subunit AhpF
MAHYDMLVIGFGSRGQKAAIQATKVGKRAGIVGRKKVAGGICINSGSTGLGHAIGSNLVDHAHFSWLTKRILILSQILFR